MDIKEKLELLARLNDTAHMANTTADYDLNHASDLADRCMDMCITLGNAFPEESIRWDGLITMWAEIRDSYKLLASTVQHSAGKDMVH